VESPIDSPLLVFGISTLNFWNQRYSQAEFAYGKEPNEYLKAKLLDLASWTDFIFLRKVEGRNAVFAAKLGWGCFLLLIVVPKV